MRHCGYAGTTTDTPALRETTGRWTRNTRSGARGHPRGASGRAPTPVHSSPARSCWRRKAAGSFENIPKWSLVAILEASDVGGLVVDVPDVQQHRATVDGEFGPDRRSEERRVGQGCGSTCKFRRSPFP